MGDTPIAVVLNCSVVVRVKLSPCTCRFRIMYMGSSAGEDGARAVEILKAYSNDDDHGYKRPRCISCCPAARPSGH